MELKEFISNAITDIVEATRQVNESAERKIELTTMNPNRTIEFDIAVSAEETIAGGAKGGIKVWGMFEAGGDASKEVANSTVSRIRFGVNVDTHTKAEHQAEDAAWAADVKEKRNRHSLDSSR